MISAFLAALGNALEVTQSKRVMDVYKMPSKTFFTLGSTLIFFVTTILVLLSGSFEFGQIRPYHYLLFLGIIVVGFFYNHLYYYALKRGALIDVEPLAMMHPLVSMVIAIVIFPDERNLYVLIPGIIAALALVLGRVRPHHLKMKKATAAMLGFVFLISIEASLLKPLLEVVSPMVLYAVRIGILATLFLIFTKPNLRKINKKSFFGTLLVSLIVALELPAYYFAIKQIGVVETSLIMLLAPVLILISSQIIFKEKITPKKAISSAVILICVAVAILIS